MINIHINEKIIKRHKSYIINSSIKQDINNLLNNNLLSQLYPKYGEEFKRKHSTFCRCLSKEYNKMKMGDKENIFLSSPKYLYRFIEIVKKEYGIIHQVINQEKEYSEIFLQAFGYSKFVDSHGLLKKEKNTEKIYSLDNFEKYENDFRWGAYAYVLSLNIKVCPYCNRNYITPLYSQDGKMRADLDHFFAKNQYPYLSISLFNLVPSCKFCNSSLKGQKEFTYMDNFNPLDNVEANDLYQITYTPKTTGCFFGGDDFNIDVEYNRTNRDWKKIKGNMDTFKIQEIYQYHKDIVTNLIKKRYVYDDGYIEYLWKSYPNLFTSKEEVVAFLISPYDTIQAENTPLGKLLKDLVEEMDFL